jgi:DNA-binding NarL/FixJ family response regulator
MMVCGESDNIRSARDEIARCKPQLLVTALRLGTGDSLEFVKALKTEQPALLVLVEATIGADASSPASHSGERQYIYMRQQLWIIRGVLRISRSGPLQIPTLSRSL